MSLEGIDDAYQPTPMQAGMLFHCLKNEGSDVYITYISVDIQGSLSVSRFQSAWQYTLGRHESLRSVFLHDGLDEPLIVVHSRVEPEWSIHDIRDADKAEQARCLQSFLQTEQATPLDSAKAPLMRFRLIQLEERQWSLQWTIHHLLADGWSTPIILSDVLASYGCGGDRAALLPATDFKFAHHVAWLASRDQEVGRDYWARELNGVQPFSMNLPSRLLAVGDSGDSTQFNEQSCEVSEAWFSKLENRCRQHRLTISTVVHGVWALLMAELSAQARVVFGTSTAGRSSDVAGIDQAVGLFLTTLPLVMDVEGQALITTWLSELQLKLQRHMAFDYIALSDMSALAGLAADERLFDTLVVVESHAADMVMRHPECDLALSHIEYKTHSHFPLVLLAYPGESLRLTLVYDASQFTTGDVSRMLNQYVQLFESLLQVLDTQPAGSLEDVYAKAFDRETLWLRGLGDSSVVASEHCRVDRWFESVCDSTPTAVAVVCNESSLTYAELDQYANRIAHALLNQIAKRPTDNSQSLQQPLIGIYLPRSINQIAALLAVLKSGVAYVPLDPAYPLERTRQVIREAQPLLIIAENRTRSDIQGLGVNILELESVGTQSGERPDLDFGGEQLAYVMFTSGSTGKPKGVCISHANLMYSTQARIAQYDSPRNCFLLLSSVSFDSSVAGIYGTLCSGGVLVLPLPGEEKELDVIGKLIYQNRVSRMLMLPSLYQLLLQQVSAEWLKSLQIVIVAGEACLPDVVTGHFSQLPDAQLYNEYGPTEACVWCAVYLCLAQDQTTIPIGKPVADTLLVVLGTNQQPCLPGVVGELCIASRGVSPGYWQQYDDSESSFIEPGVLYAKAPRFYRTGDLAWWRDDGELVYVGRKDRQLKIRGYRIEPGEIEATIRQTQRVGDVVVVGSNGHTRTVRAASVNTERRMAAQQNARQQLIAYCTPTTDALCSATVHTDVSTATILDMAVDAAAVQAVQEALPAHMWPSHWVLLSELPRLPNGKIDERRLPELLPVRSRESSLLVSRAGEPSELVVLCDILAVLLGVDRVEPDDNFFELGGDSITAIQFVSKARAAGVSLTVAAVTRQPTLRVLAEAQHDKHSRAPSVNSVGEICPTPVQQWFLSQNHPQPEYWNLAGILHCQQPLNPGLLEQCITWVVEQYPVLASRFRQLDGEGWTIEIPEEQTPDSLVSFSAPSSEQEIHLLTLGDYGRVIDSLQRQFKLEDGWLIRFQYVQVANQYTGKLVWVAHHLIVDLLSINVLIEAIMTRYLECEKQTLGKSSARSGNLPASGSISFREWSVRLLQRYNERTQTPKIQADSITSHLNSSAVRYFDPSVTSATESDKSFQISRMDAMTHVQINAMNTQFNTDALELIICALGEALCLALQRESMVLDVEHHGRDLLGDELDTSESVGWFTNIFPVDFYASTSGDWAERIKSAKEQFRQARSDNRFALLEQYSAAGGGHSSGLQGVLINYHGNKSHAFDSDTLWQHQMEPWPFLRAPTSVCSHALELNAWLLGGSLHFHWQYINRCIDDSFLQKLESRIDENLSAMVNAMEAAQTRQFTPSDFPDLDMDQSELDEFLDSLA